MERIRNPKPAGLTGTGLHNFGILFAFLGALGRGILQNRLLHLGSVTAGELLQAMQSSDSVMLLATLALVFRAMETCALPIFAFLLAEGSSRTAGFSRYFLRVTALAFLTEIPYNLAISGEVLDLSSRNPVFGLVVALVVAYFFRRFGEKKPAHIALGVIATLAGMVWCRMLHIQYGASLVFLFAVLWAMKDKPALRGVAGAGAAMLCCLSTMFYLASPMGFLPVHFYNGEKGTESRLRRYAAYPVFLLLIAGAGAVMTRFSVV